MTHTGKLWEAARHDQSDPGQQYLSIRTFWHIVFPGPARGSRRAGTSQAPKQNPRPCNTLSHSRAGYVRLLSTAPTTQSREIPNGRMKLRAVRELWYVLARTVLAMTLRFSSGEQPKCNRNCTKRTKSKAGTISSTSDRSASRTQH